MKKLLITLTLAACTAVSAQSIPRWLLPSPVGMILAISSYIDESKEKVYYVKVQSSAASFEAAKSQAFRIATEQVAGSVILSETELRNSAIARDEIVSYTSGIVNRYNILDRQDTGAGTTLTMEVWVSESRIAQRLLAQSTTERGVNGSVLAARSETILDERQRGDALLQMVVRDIPARSFEVRSSRPEIFMDVYRNIQVSVPYTVHWDRRYVDSLNAALAQISNPPQRCWIFCTQQPAFKINGYEFNDPYKLALIINHVRAMDPHVRLEIQDMYKRPLLRQCVKLALMREDFDLHHPNSTMIWWHNNVLTFTNVGLQGRFVLNFGQNSAAAAQSDQIKLDVVPKSECPQN